jgi:hypothetical protein
MNTIAFVLVVLAAVLWVLWLTYEMGFSNGLLDAAEHDSTRRDQRP